MSYKHLVLNGMEFNSPPSYSDAGSTGVVPALVS